MRKNNANDAKSWSEPQIEVASAARTLNRTALRQALRVVEQNLGRLLEAWNAHKPKTH